MLFVAGRVDFHFYAIVPLRVHKNGQSFLCLVFSGALFSNIHRITSYQSIIASFNFRFSGILILCLLSFILLMYFLTAIKIKMKLSQTVSVGFFAAVVIGVALAAGDSKDKKKGLQIGVKKRVDPEDCKVKSKKGDTLHMHYTVS